MALLVQSLIAFLQSRDRQCSVHNSNLFLHFHFSAARNYRVRPEQDDEEDDDDGDRGSVGISVSSPAAPPPQRAKQVEAETMDMAAMMGFGGFGKKMLKIAFFYFGSYLSLRLDLALKS